MALETELMLEMYRKMATIRTFNHRAAVESLAGNIPAAIRSHEGEEGSSVGVCAALNPDDWITSTHRSHGHAVAKGMDIGDMMAELFGRVDGCCHGKGGTMHLADFSRGMMGANGIVGGGLPLATGAALAAQMAGQGQVAVAFFGDGASNEGSFHSSMNLASIWKLPIVYVCENNGWAIGVSAEYALSVEDVATRAVSYSFPGVTVNGTDVLAVYEAAQHAVARARSGAGPTLLECKVYRHYTDGEVGQRRDNYRWGERGPGGMLVDPLISFGERLVEQGVSSAADLQSIDAQVDAAVDAAVAFAQASPFPQPQDALTEVFAE